MKIGCVWVGAELRLTRGEEHAVLAFMMTLSDDTPEEFATYDLETGILHLPVVNGNWTSEIFDVQLTGPFNFLGLTVR